MKRSEFLKNLKQMDACDEGYDAAKESRGAVFTVAKRWRDSPEGSINHVYYSWLRDELSGFSDDWRCDLTKKGLAQMLELIRRLEPDFKTNAEEDAEEELDKELEDAKYDLDDAECALEGAQEDMDQAKADLAEAEVRVKNAASVIKESTEEIKYCTQKVQELKIKVDAKNSKL